MGSGDLRHRVPPGIDAGGEGAGITLGSVGEPRDLALFLTNAAEWEGPKASKLSDVCHENKRSCLCFGSCFPSECRLVFRAPSCKFHGARQNARFADEKTIWCPNTTQVFMRRQIANGKQGIFLALICSWIGQATPGS